jgi:hypothetical protein
VEFRALFSGDDVTLHRIGVRSVEELMMYVDVTGKPRLDMQEVCTCVFRLRVYM